MLRFNKMSVEKTKQKLDMYYAGRNLFEEFYNEREPLKKNMKSIYQTA